LSAVQSQGLVVLLAVPLAVPLAVLVLVQS
jgi:hypothetical protein